MIVCLCVCVCLCLCMNACMHALAFYQVEEVEIPVDKVDIIVSGMDGLLVQGTPSFPAAPSAAKARTAPLANQHQSGLFAGMTV